MQQCILAVSTNGRILGLAESGRTPKALASFLFGTPADLETLPADAKAPFQEWRNLQSGALTIRPKLRTYLLATCGCFQGTGDTPNAVDVVRLVEHYPSNDVRLDLHSMDRISTDERQSLTG